MNHATMLAAAVIAIVPLAAAAQSLPRYDVRASCREVASVGGTYSEMTMSGCLQMEQSSYDSLKRIWGSLSPNMQTSCQEVATISGHGSYMTLHGCIQMEQSSARRNAETEFKY